MIFKSPFYGLFMKKLLILPIIISIIIGCTKERILEPNELNDLENNIDLAYVKQNFQNRVDAVFKYPYTSLYYEDLGYNQFEFKEANPFPVLASKCFNGDLKVKMTDLGQEIATYKIASTQDEVDQCITKRANEPMDDHAISVFSSSPVYEKYKDNPQFRNHLNSYKSDGVITIGEYMSLYRDLHEIRKIETAPVPKVLQQNESLDK